MTEQPLEPVGERVSQRRARHPALRPRLGEATEDELIGFVSAAQPAAKPASSNPSQESAQANAAGSAPGSVAAEPTRPLRRRKKTPRARFKRFVQIVVLPCLLAGIAAWALTSPRWAVSGVDVQGLSITPVEAVEGIAGAMVGRNWPRADLAGLQSQLEQLPTVRSAQVSRAWNHWPPRLQVSIQERQRWLRLGGGATWWVVDREGVAFRRATRNDENLYAVTSTAFEPQKLRAGQRVPIEIWQGASRLGQALDSSSDEGHRWQLRRAYLDRENMASLRLKGGKQNEMLVRLGDGMWPQKMERARRALLFFEAAGRRAQALNLVSFSMPTWTPLPPRQTSTAARSSANAAPSAESTTPPDAPHTTKGNSASTSPLASPAPPANGSGNAASRENAGADLEAGNAA